VCHDPPSYADGSVYTDRAFHGRQVGVEKPEEEATFLSPSIVGFWGYSQNPIS